MTTPLSAGAPLEPPAMPIGRRTVTFVDSSRGGRRIDADVWYPATASDAEPSHYELFPGVGFAAVSATHHPPVAPGRYPLIMFSHGRTGMRISYSLVCEALAARGAVVVSADHPGDALVDWITGQHVDDRTNEMNRVGDAHLVLGAFLFGHDELPEAIHEVVDHDRIAIAGHSYGAYTAFAAAAGSRGVGPHEHVGAVIGFQPFMRSMSDSLLGRVHVPSLLVVSEQDTVTPAHVDADRAWALLPGRPAWRLDVAAAGHQAISDIPLYAELAPQVVGLPQLVHDYLTATAAENRIEGGRPWRELQRDQVRLAWAFLQVALRIDPSAGEAAADRLAAAPGLTLQRR
ncbi:MAG: alpha/beta hydrolase family protein [Ilumatobacteraceae bacterium]